MWPHYFGPVEAPLFGCYHAPAAGGATKAGMLLCNPIGHEYMACYRAVRQTAMRLAQAGAPALRFDFYGSGDSAGESSDGSPSRWMRDIAAATEELQRRQGGTRLGLLGLRLGGTMALLGLQERQPVETRALILWDPVIHGGAYVAELMAQQAERYGRLNGEEILGFPFTSRMRAELEQIDLLKAERTARQVLIIETGDAKPEMAGLAERLRELGAAVEHRPVQGPAMWHEPNKASVPAAVIQSIVAWVRGGL